MDTIDKHVVLMKTLAEKTTLLQVADRINIEQKRPPHFRTYVGIGKTMTKEAIRQVEDIADELTLTANVFRVADRVSAITFVDVDEQPNAQ